MRIEDSVTVITGGGSGIGRALCESLAARGAVLAVCDINESDAQETVGRCETGAGSPHRAFSVDVAERASVNELAQHVVGTFGRVDMLVNNAGVLGQVAPLEEVSDEEFDWIIGVDLWGVINCTRAFLGHLKARPRAALVNVSSLAGLMGALGNAAYFTAKFGVRGFTETMRVELRPTGVAVTLVIPGIVKTNLAANHPDYSVHEREEAIRRYHSQHGVSPETAAARITAGIERGRPRVLIGSDAWFADKLVRIAPARYDRVFGGLLRSMANKQRPDGREVF